MCGSVKGQFVPINPSDLTTETGPITELFDISSQMGAANAGTYTLFVSNGFVTTDDKWTVDENETTTFILGGTGSLEAFVNHGANLGSEDFQNGSKSRDGIISAAGETWTLTSSLDEGRYQAGQEDNDYFVDYVGPELNSLQSNSVGFRWASDQVVSNFSVFSMNSTNLDNNYGIGFRTVNAIPEPAAGMLLALAGLTVLRRRRN